MKNYAPITCLILRVCGNSHTRPRQADIAVIGAIVWWAARTAVGTHAGTIAFGSLLITAMQAVRLITAIIIGFASEYLFTEVFIVDLPT